MAEGSAFTGSKTGAAERAEEHDDAANPSTVNAVNIKIMTLETRTPPLLWHCHLKRWHSRFVTRAIPQDALGQSAFRGPSTIRCCRGARSAEMCTV